MRVSSLRLVLSLSTLFLLPNAVHARPVELSDFRRVLVNLEGFTDDQFATIDEKFEHKNRGWGLGLISRLSDPRSALDAISTGVDTSWHPPVGDGSANGLALGHGSGLLVPSEQRGLHLGALNPPGQPGLRLGTARESDNSSDLIVPDSPQGENSVHAVPESSTMTLFGSSLVALFLVRLRQSPLF